MLRVPDAKSALFLRQELLLIDEFNDIEAEKYRQLQKSQTEKRAIAREAEKYRQLQK